MALFQNILLPLDVADQANAERAIDAARLIAIASGGDVHLLHVRLFLPMTYTPATTQVENALAERAKHVLGRLLRGEPTSSA